MASNILLRRDTLANWSNFNPVLLSGEWAFVLDDRTYRIGDGVSAFNSLEVYYPTGEVRTINNAPPASGNISLTQDNVPDGITYVRVTTAEKVTYNAKLDDAPSDGNQYGRQDGAWVEITASGGGAVDSVNGLTGAVVLTQDDVAEGSTYQRVTSSEKISYSEKLNDVSGGDANSIYGRRDGEWVNVVQGLSTQPQDIIKAPATSWATVLSEVDNLQTKNWNGYSVRILLQDGDHPMGNDVFLLQGVYNGRLIIEAENSIVAAGTNQNATITLNGSGYFQMLNCQLNIDISMIRFNLTNAGHTVPFNVDGNMILSTYRCAWDASLASQESAMLFAAGCKVASYQDTFLGNISEAASFVKLNRGADEAQGGEVQIYSASIAGNIFTYGANGKGTVAASSVAGVFSVLNGNGAIDISATANGGTIDKATLSSISISSITGSSADISGTFNRNGTMYWGVYSDGSPVPELAQIVGGTGTGIVESGTVATTANTIATDTAVGLSSATAYDTYVVALDGLANPSEKKIAVFTTAGAGLIASVLGVPTMGQTTADLTWTDTNTSPNETGVLVEYKESASGTWLTSTTTAADATSHQVTGLTASTSYDFRVTPLGDGGAVLDAPPSNIQTANTTGAGGGAFQDTMKASIAAINPHWSAGQLTWAEGIIDTAMADGSYYETTYGASGTNETDASWFMLFGVNGDTSGATTSKGGSPLRIDVNGTALTDNTCPVVTGVVDGYLIVSTTDNWFESGLNLQGCSLYRELPDFPVNFTYTVRLSGNALTGSLGANFGSFGGSTLQINDNLLTGEIPASTEIKTNIQFHNNGFTSFENGASGYQDRWMSTANFSGNAFPQSEIDEVLLTFRDFYSSTSPSTNLGLFLNGGTNAAPSATGLGYITEIEGFFTAQGRVATITTN